MQATVRNRYLIIPLLAMLLVAGCSTTNKICGRFTDWVESARAEYFATNRIYDLTPEMQQLARKYKPQLVMHPDGTPPIDFDDYLVGIDLVYAEGKRKGEIEEDVTKARISQMSYADMCQTYLKPAKEEVVSQPPYPWYVQAYRSPSPHDPNEEWLYVKYNVIFDWSGLANKLSSNARAGVNILGADPAKWHRLDVHTTVVIALDPNRRQRLVTLEQHNYVKTYLGGRDFDPDKPVTIASAYRSNELYLDDGSSTPQEYRVVTFLRHLPYLITGKNRPSYHGRDLVAGQNAGGKPLDTRVVFIEPDAPLSAYAGLLAPTKLLFGSIYVGRDGPMGYDYYAPPNAFKMEKLVALGYWQHGDEQLANELASIIKQGKGWRDTDTLDNMIETMRARLVRDLRQDL